jgi:hypothetical protein
MLDWATIAELGTAAGTLVLAIATFASVRSGNRTARLAERSLLEGIRPLLLPTRLQDPDQKVGFQDDHWMMLGGSRGALDATDEAVYLAIGVRNVGAGIAVLNAWRLYRGRIAGPDVARPDPSDFHRLTRDLYVPANDYGFWQGTFRDPKDPEFQEAAESIRNHERVTIDILYGDAEGGQRMITRFVVEPAHDNNGWLAFVSRHWNLDRSDPR